MLTGSFTSVKNKSIHIYIDFRSVGGMTGEVQKYIIFYLYTYMPGIGQPTCIAINIGRSEPSTLKMIVCTTIIVCWVSLLWSTEWLPDVFAS